MGCCSRRLSLEVLAARSRRLALACFRCLLCGDEWTIQNRSTTAHQVTEDSETRTTEDRALFTCPLCTGSMTLVDLFVHLDRATVTFQCSEHGYLAYANDTGLLPARSH